jgi:hypothetical protein
VIEIEKLFCGSTTVQAIKLHTNHIEFFAPNMTSFVQPLDAGIIRCFKAHYQHAFCIRAIDLDDAGEDDIYGINLFEIMHMARRSWDAVSKDAIKNC